MLGCAAVRQKGLVAGRMISVLAEGPPKVKLLRSERRVELCTALSPMGRNPITGGTPDRLIVLQGGAGTLVELAFGLRPVAATPVFASSLTHLRQQDRQKVLDGIRCARAKYWMNGDSGAAIALQEALITHIASAQNVITQEQDNAAVAMAVVEAALAGPTDAGNLTRPTQFEGLPPPPPRRNERLLKDEFEAAIQMLSDLELGVTFN